MTTSHNKTVAAITHLSTLSQYFLPFGNFIFPIVIWSVSKNNSRFVDHHGRQAINFQLSVLLYSIVLAVVAIPLLLVSIFKDVPLNAIINDNEIVVNNFSAGNITGVAVVAIMAVILFGALKMLEFFLVINAAVKAANGELYQYPLTIPFIGRAAADDIQTSEPTTAP